MTSTSTVIPPRLITGILLLVALVTVALAVRAHRQLDRLASPEPPATSVPAPARDAVSLVVPPPEAWAAFQNEGEGAGEPAGAGGVLSKRFRLAGTFFAYAENTPDTRKAVIDDTSVGTQHVLGEGDTIDDVLLVSIFKDKVALRSKGQEEELWISFASRGGDEAGTESGTNGTAVAEGSDNRYGGHQIGENRWVFNRGTLLDYYKELTDNPARLVKLFDSLKPVDAQGAFLDPATAGRSGQISGYKLGLEGEKDFFDAVGIKEGDVISKVNEVPMTNRQRAEHFIRQFYANNANAFVLEVQRGGTSQKLTYEVR